MPSCSSIWQYNRRWCWPPVVTCFSIHKFVTVELTLRTIKRGESFGDEYNNLCPMSHTHTREVIKFLFIIIMQNLEEEATIGKNKYFVF